MLIKTNYYMEKTQDIEKKSPYILLFHKFQMTWLLQQCMMQLKRWDGLGIQGSQLVLARLKDGALKTFFILFDENFKNFVNFNWKCLGH
jgi:hypothetical protein